MSHTKFKLSPHVSLGIAIGSLRSQLSSASNSLSEAFGELILQAAIEFRLNQHSNKENNNAVQ